jgi:O-antigen ligase
MVVSSVTFGFNFDENMLFSLFSSREFLLGFIGPAIVLIVKSGYPIDSLKRVLLATLLALLTGVMLVLQLRSFSSVVVGLLLVILAAYIGSIVMFRSTLATMILGILIYLVFLSRPSPDIFARTFFPSDIGLLGVVFKNGIVGSCLYLFVHGLIIYRLWRTNLELRMQDGRYEPLWALLILIIAQTINLPQSQSLR